MLQAYVLSRTDLLDRLIEYLGTWTTFLDHIEEPIQQVSSGTAFEYEGLVQVPIVEVDLVWSHVERRSRLRYPLLFSLRVEDFLAGIARSIHLDHKAEEE